MGIYLSPHRVDLKFVDGLRLGGDRAWRRLLPEIEQLGVKEREPFEHFLYEETLSRWDAVRYLQAARFFVKRFGAALETEVWGIINHTSAYDIFERIDDLIAPLSLPVSLITDLQLCSGTLWGMPLVDGVALARMDPGPIAKAARIVQKCLARQDEALREAESLLLRYKDEPQLFLCLRHAAFCYRVGRWNREELAGFIALLLSQPADLDHLRDRADDTLQNLWGGEERASHLFDGARKFFDWILEASAHDQGIVYFLE